MVPADSADAANTEPLAGRWLVAAPGESGLADAVRAELTAAGARPVTFAEAAEDPTEPCAGIVFLDAPTDVPAAGGESAERVTDVVLRYADVARTAAAWRIARSSCTSRSARSRRRARTGRWPRARRHWPYRACSPRSSRTALARRGPAARYAGRLRAAYRRSRPRGPRGSREPRGRVPERPGNRDPRRPPLGPRPHPWRPTDAVGNVARAGNAARADNEAGRATRRRPGLARRLGLATRTRLATDARLAT
ncbi:hypothetical protein NKH77_04410 [Streptomyces sp. M19]